MTRCPRARRRGSRQPDQKLEDPPPQLEPGGFDDVSEDSSGE